MRQHSHSPPRHRWIYRPLGTVLCLLLTTQASRSVHAQEEATAGKTAKGGTSPASAAGSAKGQRQIAKRNKARQDGHGTPEPADESSTSAARTAHGSPASEARRKATVALNTGHYQEAIKALEEAYALDQDPDLLFDLARAHRLAGQPTRALEACASYLRSAGISKNDRVQAELFMAEVTMIAYQIQLQREGTGRSASSIGPMPAQPAQTTTRDSIEPPALGENRPGEGAVRSEEKPLDLTPRPAVKTTPALVEVKSASEPEPVHHFYESPKLWIVVGAVAVLAGAGLGYWAWERSRGLKSPSTNLGYQAAF
jgi:hypothetical protein